MRHCLASMILLVSCLAPLAAAAQEAHTIKVPMQGVSFEIPLARGWLEQSLKTQRGLLLLEDTKRTGVAVLYVEPLKLGTRQVDRAMGVREELKKRHAESIPVVKDEMEKRGDHRVLHLQSRFTRNARYDHSQPTHARHIFAWLDGVHLWTLTLDSEIKDEQAAVRDLEPALEAMLRQTPKAPLYSYAMEVEGASSEQERESFHRFIIANMDRVSKCKAPMDGLRVKIETRDNGKVSKATVVDHAGKERDTDKGLDCVVEKVSAIRFPERKGSGLRFTFDFTDAPRR